MKVLILGSGGREHALAWKLSKDLDVDSVIVMPGNPGMDRTDKVETINGSWNNREKFLKSVTDIAPDYVIVGPEGPLALGVADWLSESGVAVVGPSAKAAQLESSKIFSKKFMLKYDIPTANFKVANGFSEGTKYLNSLDFNDGIVIKADGLAAGKGVVVTQDLDEAHKTIYDFTENESCTVNTKKILFEKVLKGKELSVFALCDGEHFINLGYACDYKRVFDGDKGPNTGGMGGYLPTGWPSQTNKNKIQTIIQKTLSGMVAEGTPFRGFLFVGLMIDGEEVNVIEFNVRMGDPETQILMPLLDERFSKFLYDVAKGCLIESIDISPLNKSCVHIVLTSGGYPSTDGSSMKLNYKIEELSVIDDNIEVFYSGVKINDGNQLINTGGRVLGISAIAETTEKAKKLAYKNIKNYQFEGMHYRYDIAKI